MTNKTIVVTGATGLQGGSVARLFLSDPKLKGEWKVRGITRDVTKEKAKELQAMGAEMVQADMDDPATLEKAFQGAEAVFAVTNYWETMNKEKEVQQGKNMADAAKKQGVKKYIWSSLPDVNKLSNGALPNVHHFDGKAEVEDYVRKNGLPASFLFAGMYMTNFKKMELMAAAKDDSSIWKLGLVEVPPTAKIPLFDSGDTGKFVKAMVMRWEEVAGKHVLGATDYWTPVEMLEQFREVFPNAVQDATFHTIPKEKFMEVMSSAGTADFVATEMEENFRFMGQFGYFGGESLEWSTGLVEKNGDRLTGWKEFAKQEWNLE